MSDHRSIGPVTATAVVVANMVGAGFFVTSGFMAANLPSAGWLIGCWLAGGVIAMAGALCYAELATRMPVTGGEYAYLTRIYHPMWGFLTGWTSLIAGFSAPIAASALGFSAYVLASLAGSSANTGVWGAPWLTRGIAVVVILVFTAIHARGIKVGARVHNALTGMKVLLILGFVIAGSAAAGRSPVVTALPGPSGGGGMALGTAMLLAMFAYSGWNASAYFAGELKDPRRTLPLSLILGTGIVIVLYLAMNLFIVRSVPYSQLAGNATAAEAAVVNTIGSHAGRFVSGLIGFALLSSLSAYVLIGPRIYYAMARDGLFFRFARQLHPRYRVPSRSIVLQGVLATGMVLVGGLEQLLVFLGFALGVFPLLAVAGIFVARRRKIGEAQAVRVPGYPLIPILFLVTNLALLVVAFHNRPLESGVALATVFLGVPCYLLWTRGRTRQDTALS